MNKNTRRIRNEVRKAGKAGDFALTFQVPVQTYHNHPKTTLRPITVTTAIRGAGGVISTSGSRRNMQMRVLHNSDGDSRKASMTVHEPINASIPVMHPNHEYIRNDKRVGYYQRVK